MLPAKNVKDPQRRIQNGPDHSQVIVGIQVSVLGLRSNGRDDCAQSPVERRSKWDYGHYDTANFGIVPLAQDHATAIKGGVVCQSPRNKLMMLSVRFDVC